MGLEQGPARLDPRKNAEKARGRRQHVLGAWQTCGIIPPGSAVTLESTSVLDGVIASPTLVKNDD